MCQYVPGSVFTEPKKCQWKSITQPSLVQRSDVRPSELQHHLFVRVMVQLYLDTMILVITSAADTFLAALADFLPFSPPDAGGMQ